MFNSISFPKIDKRTSFFAFISFLFFLGGILFFFGSFSFVFHSFIVFVDLILIFVFLVFVYLFFLNIVYTLSKFIFLNYFSLFDYFFCFLFFVLFCIRFFLCFSHFHLEIISVFCKLFFPLNVFCISLCNLFIYSFNFI